MLYRVALPLALLSLAILATACSGSNISRSNESPTPESSPQVTICSSPIGAARQPMSKTYQSRPSLSIDPAKKYLAVIKTVHGEFTIELRPDIAPETVNSFVFLARDGYYDSVTFHRVIPGFMAQGGDPTGSGMGGPGYTLPAEFSDVPYERGTVGAARSASPDSGGSQFFIAFAPQPSLNGQYTVFGKVTEGMDVVDCLAARDPSRNPNAPAGDAIISIEIQEQ